MKIVWDGTDIPKHQQQIMHEIVMSLVEPSSTKIPIKDEERQAWREAAETWRLPYWDPGVRRSYNDDYSCIPRSAMNEISVDPPTNPGGPTLIFTENPLYAYRYPLIPPDNLKQHGMVDYLDPKTGDVTAPVSNALPYLKPTPRHGSLQNM